MPQVMETNVPVASRSLNAGGFQCLVESIAQGGNRIPSRAWAGKERLLGSAAGEVLGRQCPDSAPGAEPSPAQSEPFLTCRTWYAGYAARLRRGRHRPV